jgi:hypothetical protein
MPLLERAFVLALAVALVLHLPLMPLRIFEWLSIAFRGEAHDYDDRDAQAILPIDLDLLARDLVPEAPKAPPSAPSAGPSSEGAADAGAPRDAGAPKPSAPPSHETSDAGPRPLADPTSAAGGAGKIAAKDPNVQVLIAGNVLRKHDLGPWAARLLVNIPEWRGFFEQSPVDPIRDFNHLLITAPRFQGDSSKLVAVIEYNVSSDLVRDAIDQVLRRTNGVWLEDAPVTTARARVGGAVRLFAELPERRLLVVLPEDAMDQLERLKRAKGFRNSAEGVIVSMLTPAHPFRDFFPLPESLKWLRVALTPTPDGGADLALDAGDRSNDEARAHAEVLTKELEARRKVNVLGLTSFEVVDPVSFAADGDVIRGRTHVARSKLHMIMGYVEQKARERFGVAPP